MLQPVLLIVSSMMSTQAAVVSPAADPIPVNVDNFARAETDTYFAKTVVEGGFGKLQHDRLPTSIDDQKVVRMSRGTLYSSGAFDLSTGPLTITLPNAVGTRYVFVIIRTLVAPEKLDDVGFWSVSVYNSKGYFEKNSLNAYPLNNLTAKGNVDRFYTVQFVGCSSAWVNCLPIMTGWNYTVRLYRPRNPFWTVTGPSPWLSHCNESKTGYLVIRSQRFVDVEALCVRLFG